MDIEAHEWASLEDHHWWFVGRRAVIVGLLRQFDLPPSARVLEAGCGTGGNLYQLERLGEISAFEPSLPALEIARREHPYAVVEAGELPSSVPFPDGSFDLVASLDVLEHIEDDRAALESLVRLTKPGGVILLTVPTHPFLWGPHDRRFGHKRRYGIRAFRSLCAAPGTRLLYFGAFNTILAPMAFSARLVEKLLGVEFGLHEGLVPRWVNTVLAAAFSLEGRMVGRIPLPVGLSHAAILRRDT